MVQVTEILGKAKSKKKYALVLFLGGFYYCEKGL